MIHVILYLNTINMKSINTWCALVLIFCTTLSYAQINGESPPFALSVDQLKSWTSDGPTASADNVATVPLADRFVDAATQLNPELSPDIRILAAPDGINNKGNYTSEQAKFNLFNFTHWQYIDILNWFGGTASLNVMLPSAPWVNAAHRNGVQVIGSVFFAPTAFGGNTATIQSFLEKDASGNFISAHKLVEIATYYGFDGWLINQETSTTLEVANTMREFMAYLDAIKPAGMQIIWYDAMIETGPVFWQNQLNALNDAYLQDVLTKTSDGMFTNYNWASPYVTSSAQHAQALGRSPFDVYMGADLWPDRNAQPAFRDVSWIDDIFNNGDVSDPLTSIALFATNFTFDKFHDFSNNPNEVQAFYDTERRFYAGDDRDPDQADPSGDWKGIGHYVPARSVITDLPFVTSFNTGHGRIFAIEGQSTTRDWHDMSKQDILPTWQFSVEGNDDVQAAFDFTTAYNGGTSLHVSGDLAATAPATLKLYKTNLLIEAATVLDLTFLPQVAGPTHLSVALTFADAPTTPILLEVGESDGPGWQTIRLNLAEHQGRSLSLLGFQLASTTDVTNYQVHIGQIKVHNDTSPPPVADFSATKTTLVAGESTTFTDQSTGSPTSWAWTFEGGTPAQSDQQHPTVTYATPGSYTVTLTVSNLAGEDMLTRTDYITVLSPDTEVDHTDPVGTGIITSRADNGEAEDRYKAFDNRYIFGDFTQWGDPSGIPTRKDPSWIQIQLPEPEIVHTLALVSAREDMGSDPEKFELLASHDGVNFVVLDSWTGVHFDSRYQRKEWHFDNTTAYTYYRLEINKNDEQVPLTQLGEIQLIGPAGTPTATNASARIPASVSAHSQLDDLRLYPNPVRQSLFLEVPEQENIQWQIFSQNGVLLKAGSDSQTNTEILLDELPAGWYRIRIINASGEAVYRSFIKL